MIGRLEKLPYCSPAVTAEFSRAQLRGGVALLLGPGMLNGAIVTRQLVELRESVLLSPHAWPSSKSLGRLTPITEDNRSVYARDRDRILFTKALATLAGKTQLFTFPRRPDIHNRRFHVDKVADVGRDIGRQLGLNEDLIEAIGRGHDLGHTPFGHDGEKALSEISERALGRSFRHNLHSLRVIDVIEAKNLTAEVRNGIVCHLGERLDEVLIPGPIPADLANLTDVEMPYTLEGCVIRLTDILVYLAHDYADALKLKLVTPDDLPLIVQETIGTDPDDMIGVMVDDVINQSQGQNHITMSPRMLEMRAAFFEFVYKKIIGSQPVQAACQIVPDIMTTLYQYYTEKRGLEPQTAIDRIASLTDRQARNYYRKIKRG
jgi:dGTPase